MNIEKLTWYVARSGGIVAWCVLALSLILGLALSSRVLGKRVSPAWTLAVHRYLGGLAVIFTGIHIVAVMLDDFVDFGFVEVLVPFASSWRPGAVAWGIVGLYLLLAIELTSLAMRRLPKQLWRWVHWTSALLFVTATIHGFLAGSDVGRAFIVATVSVIIVLGALVAVRATRARAGTSGRAEPRVLLDQVEGRKTMRPEPPHHVLDSLTLASRPLAVSAHDATEPTPERAATADVFAAFPTAAPPRRPQPKPAPQEPAFPTTAPPQHEPAFPTTAPPQHEPAFPTTAPPQHEPAFPTTAPPRQPQPKPAPQEPEHERVSLGGAVAVKQRSAPPKAEAVSQPEWDRPSPPPPPPESIEDALPEVPWAMPAPDIGGPDRSPGRWRPADRPAASGPDGPGGPTSPSSGSRDDADLQRTAGGGQEPSATDGDKSTPFGGEAPKPPWAAPEATERTPGPAPGVWKRTSPRSGDAQTDPAPERGTTEPDEGGSEDVSR